MADALAIYGAVATSLHLLGKFIDVCQRYGELPKEIDQGYCSLKGCEAALKEWKDRFRLQPGRPHDFYRVLWGEDERDIAHILNDMQHICEKVRDTVKGVMTVATRQRDIRIYDGRVDEEFLRDKIRAAKDGLGGWTRVKWAIKNQAKGLRQEIDDFERQFTNLQRISRTAFRTVHNINIDRVEDTSTVIHGGLYYRKTRLNAAKLHDAFKYQPDPIRCYFALGTIVDERRQWSPNANTRGSRRNSDTGASHNQDGRQLTVQGRLGVSRPSRSASVGSTSQGLTVYRSSRSPGIRFHEYIQDVHEDRHFQFLLQYTGISYPIVIRPVRFEGTHRAKDQIRFTNSFIGVIAELEREELCNLTTMDVEPKRFRIQKYEGPVLKDLNRIAKFEEQLAHLPLKAKAQVAHTIAAGLFRIIGSPWGDYLEGDNLAATRINRRRWAVGMAAVSANSRIAMVLEAMEGEYQVAGISHAVHGQIFRLGVILAELGLGTTLRRVRVSGDKIKLDFGRGYNSTVSVASEVQTKTGSQYWYKVVSFCLGVYQRRDYLGKRSLDYEFEKLVLEPYVLSLLASSLETDKSL
jgi:hypothetical protein